MSSKVAGQTAKVVRPVAPKSLMPRTVKGSDSETTAKNSKMHRRSRSGCFTCRLRRKKCNEEKPGCRACRHLGLKCEYKRPLWWSNNEQRKAQKENIKEIIKRTKVNEKGQQGHDGADSPPGLTHSLPTSATVADAPTCTRAQSHDSYNSFDFNQPLRDHIDIYKPQVYTPQFESQFDTHPAYHSYSTPPIPYEVDIKTERQMFVNDVQTRIDTSVSTFSTFHAPLLQDPLAGIPEENWLHEAIYDDPTDIFGTGGEDNNEFGIFDFSHSTAPPSQQASIAVDEADRHLLEYFIDNVLPLTFPVLEVNQPGLARSEVILPALESNKTYLHCCLTAAAVHMKFSKGINSAQLDNDILRHRVSTINESCESFKRNTQHEHILDATLAMIFFQSATGHPDDTSPDIAWHQHFGAAAELVKRLGLEDQIVKGISLTEDPLMPPHPPFSMSLAAWIDILGATMLGQAPVFANAYRETHLASRPLGLGALMGCEDALMVLISEIACLDALQLSHTVDDVSLCSHITMLGQQMDLTERTSGSVGFAYSESGALRPRQLGCNVSALFRQAARIWLQSLVPGATRTEKTMKGSLAYFAELMDLVPGGPQGFDRSVVWPVFIAGVQTTAGCGLRQKIEHRYVQMGEGRDMGAWGRMIRALRTVWARNDAAAPHEDHHWRDVVRECRLDFLPI